jgi:hypothetical protein
MNQNFFSQKAKMALMHENLPEEKNLLKRPIEQKVSMYR